MYTGLVAATGRVAAMTATGDGARLRVETPLAAELGEGDSIAVNGVCLTAISPTSTGFEADTMHETLRRSSLGDLEPGGRVNLELSLRVGDRLGGHFVQGHVDGVGVVSAVREDGFARVVTVDADPGLLRYIVEKGSIAVEGVSLTVARVDGTGFDISLIPETQARTTLGAVAPGSRLNLEVDVLAKHVEKLFGTSGEGP